jgi:hypothetical protein
MMFPGATNVIRHLEVRGAFTPSLEGRRPQKPEGPILRGPHCVLAPQDDGERWELAS